ncbi:MAG: DUF262 domain-containing HNH endonuclease family protein [Candidatus Acidiferrales bacterium]
MADKDSIGFEHKGIGAVLAQNRLRVPLNQREYAWEDEHVQELFSDFAGSIDNDRPTYFLGTVVLTHGSDEPEVSDGQQRLATTTILLTAIRDYLKSIKDFARASSIEQDFLKMTDFETTETVPRLRLNVDDNEFFKSYVIDGDHSVLPKLESHKKIKTASDLAVKHVSVILEPHQKQTAKTATLQRWVKFIREGAQVVVLRVPDHLNAFVMFETLNDRGLKASQADLIKNYLLRLCADHIAEGQQKWAKMKAVLDSIGEGDITVTYLHHLLITKQGPTKEREVFDKVRGIANSRSKALQFLEDAAESADDYAALFNPGATKWNEYGTSTRKHLTTINRDLRVEQIRPLMFAVARHFSVNEAKKAFRLFVYWSVRFLIVGGRGGLLDRNYSLRSQEVSNKTVKNAAQLAAALDIIPSDALFAQAFTEVRVSQDFIARYLLRALELKAKGQSEPENIPNDEENVINVEHVLPAHPENNWPNIDKEMASALYRRLGNMVLMQASKNSIIGNSAFSDKKKVLKESAYILTSEVANESKWEAKQIKERQARLAAIAVQTWPSSLS